MGDRCYMQITCRRKDQELFEDIGFHVESDERSERHVIEMVDEEANYAHWNEMSKNVPYFGHNGHGDNYSDGIFACDGKRYAEVEAGYAGGFVVAWNTKTNQPDRNSLRSIRRYLAVRDRVRVKFEALAKPHRHRQPHENHHRPPAVVAVRRQSTHARQNRAASS